MASDVSAFDAVLKEVYVGPLLEQLNYRHLFSEKKSMLPICRIVGCERRAIMTVEWLLGTEKGSRINYCLLHGHRNIKAEKAKHPQVIGYVHTK